MNFTAISKKVGWTPPKDLEWPVSILEIKEARAFHIVQWYRFLPSPLNNWQVKFMTKIIKQFNELKKD